MQENQSLRILKKPLRLEKIQALVHPDLQPNLIVHNQRQALIQSTPMLPSNFQTFIQNLVLTLNLIRC